MKFVAAIAVFGSAVASTSLLNGWEETETKLDPATSMKLRFALERAEPSALEEALISVSNPSSLRFRKYLNDADISHLVRPQNGAAAAVQQWARSTLGEGSTIEHSQHGDYLWIQTTVDGVRKAFEGVIEGLSVFSHEASKPSIRAVAPSATPSSLVPDALRGHVSAVFELVDFMPVPPRKKLDASKEPGDLIEPPVLHKQYGMSGSAADIGGRTKTSQGVAMFEQAEFQPSDLAAFQDAYALPEVKFQLNGPNDGGYFGEATLDTQWITATGRGVPSWWIARDSFDMLAWCEQVLNMTAPPSVVSISWGSGESNFNPEHLQAGSDCFQKMGVQGITVFTASGDEGTGKQGMFGCKKFAPEWPASCPYITTVGGTYLQSAKEIAWTNSGGGFSSVFSRPTWQDKTVAAYKASASLPDSSLWSPDGCAKPDIAALSTNYQVFSGGVAAGTLSGTSASSPAFAGMIAVVNDLLAASGKPPVGFINPVLYAAAEASTTDFLGYDVVDGNNKHSGCKAGFPAVEGWDAVTGLGTPNLQKLKAVLMRSAELTTDTVVA